MSSEIDDTTRLENLSQGLGMDNYSALLLCYLALCQEVAEDVAATSPANSPTDEDVLVFLELNENAYSPSRPEPLPGKWGMGGK